MRSRLSLIGFFFLAATCSSLAAAQEKQIRIAKFDIDATPPVGFMMAYDRVKRIEALALRCRGLVILGSGDPIVLCAVDWIGIGNEAHDAFRDTIAAAAGTTRDRVAVHTLHQHDAPRCDFTAERLLNDVGASDLGAHEGSFAREVLKRLKTAVADSLPGATKVTHAAVGEANVEKVASNRRIQDDTGKVIGTRYTTCRDPKMRALPDGIIDPVCTTISFWNDKAPVAVLSYYACHPQSYYRTGVPSPDFPGIARLIRGQDVPETLHVHFNGAGGNIGAGKYNDGNKANRMALAGRLADGMKRSFESAKKFPLTSDDVGWYVEPVALPLGKHLVVNELRANVAKWNTKDYWGSPEQLAWALRCESGHKIDLGCLKIGRARVLHMPGELFVEYQLAAKKLRPELNVAMAAYGDYGPGYIGTDEAYGQGGYETSERASKVAPGVEKALMGGVKKLLDAADAVGDFSAELPRIPPSNPVDAMKTFQIKDGYEMQLVASEPLIGSPVAIEWDADGRMYVCEMRGYSEDQELSISTIGLLTDTNDDGVYDLRSEFASGLRWPTAIFPYDGGLFVGDAPDLLYLKDTDGDGKADVQRKVLTGFGTTNVQGLMNSMRWTLDNEIQIACSSTGGKIQKANGSGDALNIRGRDLALNPRTLEYRSVSGAAQHGMCFDDWGRKFVSSNSNHIQQVMYEDHHIARNRWLRAPPVRASIAVDGPQAEVYRSSPTEPWRVVRTRLRVAGKVRGPVEGGGRAAGYFTGATGLTIYRGDAWRKEHRGLAIVGDVGSNLIHRKRLAPVADRPFRAERMDEKSEFVTSSDIWFRPVQFANAPDGTLYVIDMCREVIEHPKSLPPEIKKHLDLTAGRDRGRIYRLAPTGFRHQSAVNLGSATTAELVKSLENPNAWQRETAARLLFERQDAGATPALRTLIAESESPRGCIHALYAIHGIGGLDAAAISIALGNPHAQVRRHAVRLAERAGLLEEVEAEVLMLAGDESSEVRTQVAYALGSLKPSEEISEALANIVKVGDAGPWVQVAVQSSLGPSPFSVLKKLIDDSDFRSDAAQAFLSKLVAQVQKQTNPEDVRRTTELLQSLSTNDPGFTLPLAGQLLDSRHPSIEKMVIAAKSIAMDESIDSKQRVLAIQSLRFGSFSTVQEPLARLLSPIHGNALQKASLGTLSQFQEPAVADLVLNAWPELSPTLRLIATEILFSRAEWTSNLFDNIDEGKFALRQIPLSRFRLLQKSKHKDLVARSKTYLSEFGTGQRAEWVEKYKPSLTMKANADRGLEVFKKSCAACHRLDGVGHETGPNLAAMKARGAESILVNVLDPSREVNPQYVNYSAVLSDGRVVTGMVASESATSVTLRRGNGESDTILRADIETLQSTGVSIMPDGLEQTINLQQMADLISYLMRSR